MSDVKEYILDALQREYSFPEGVDLNKFNYVEEGFMDSLGLLQFIAELEDEFNIEFTDAELESPDFKLVGPLCELVESKM